MIQEETGAGAAAPAELRELFVELNDLKRVRSAGREGTIAERLFAQGWAMLTGGARPEDVALDITATALAATRLTDLDAAFLTAAGLTVAETAGVLRAGFDEVTGALDPDLRARLRARLTAQDLPEAGFVPGFVGALAAQPRAGVTCPGKPRILLEPPENHAEHCLMVAVYGVCLSPFYRADPGTVFLAAMAHHFHNAAMPDAGFTGEVLLGGLLDRVIDAAREQAMAMLDPAVAAPVRAALAPIGGDATPAARAFHAADVLDRVLEIEQHLRAASATMDTVLHTYELVHAGPVKTFHDRVLAEVGLL